MPRCHYRTRVRYSVRCWDWKRNKSIERWRCGRDERREYDTALIGMESLLVSFKQMVVELFQVLIRQSSLTLITNCNPDADASLSILLSSSTDPRLIH